MKQLEKKILNVTALRERKYKFREHVADKHISLKHSLFVVSVYNLLSFRLKAASLLMLIGSVTLEERIWMWYLPQDAFPNMKVRESGARPQTKR